MFACHPAPLQSECHSGWCYYLILEDEFNLFFITLLLIKKLFARIRRDNAEIIIIYYLIKYTNFSVINVDRLSLILTGNFRQFQF